MAGCYGVLIVWGNSAWFLKDDLIALFGLFLAFTAWLYFIYLLLPDYFYLISAEFFFLNNAVANPCFWRVLVVISGLFVAGFKHVWWRTWRKYFDGTHPAFLAARANLWIKIQPLAADFLP